MKWVLILLALFLVAAAPSAPCPQPSEYRCAIGGTAPLKLSGDVITAERIIRIDSSALPLERPLTVRFAGLASAEFYWNNVRIGGNGVPAETREAEVAGRYFATVIVPASLLRPGDNLVRARLSGQHLWLPVKRPIHILDVGSYETPELPGRSAYVPALLVLGAIFAAFLYFLGASISGGTKGSRLVASFALVALLQLVTEVSRAYISFNYPWALGRVTMIAVLAAITAVIMATYGARRFLQRRQSWLINGTAVAAIASLILLPWFDLKAMAALLAGAIATGVASIFGIRSRIAGAHWGAALSLLIIAAMAWELTAFLDMAWFLIAAAILILLVLEQLGQLRRARAEAARVSGLEERLREAETAGEPIVQLRDGSRSHRVAEKDILYARGADDYCEVRLTDGRELLVTTSLARLQTSLSASFFRIHKSYVVNISHVRGLEPRPGGGRLLRLGTEERLPVGRSFEKAVVARAGPAPDVAKVRPSPAGC